MRKILLVVGFLGLMVTGCLNIEEDPLVTVDPAIFFRAHVRSANVFVTAEISANPTFIEVGNIPTVFEYEGILELYDERSGELLNSVPIEGDGLRTLVEISAAETDYNDIIAIASGTVSAYADKESDGNRSNDLFMHEADFYEVNYLRDLIVGQDFPVVSLSPAVTFQTHIRNEELYTTATVQANPVFQVTGEDPIRIEYEGVLQVYDEISGALLKSSAISGEGLNRTTTVVADTASFDGFVVIASGTVTCTADVDSDGDDSNDFFINSAQFNDLLLVDLREDTE